MTTPVRTAIEDHVSNFEGDSSGTQWLRQSSLKGKAATGTEPRPDFITLISIVSEIYKCRKYLGFSEVDFNIHDVGMKRIDTSANFVRYEVMIEQQLPSEDDFGVYEKKTDYFLSKEVRRFFDSEGYALASEVTALERFLVEIQILSHAELHWHPNIINFVGIGWHHDQFTPKPTVQPCLILEDTSHTLKNYLDSSNDLHFLGRLRLVSDIAQGLAALHACGVIHGNVDLTTIVVKVGTPFASSILTSTAKIAMAKIGDFSHSCARSDFVRPPPPDHTRRRAVELYHEPLVKDPEAIDVFDFGMVALKVFLPYTDFSTNLVPDTSSVDSRRHAHAAFLVTVRAALHEKYDDDEGEINRPLISRLLETTLAMEPSDRKLEHVLPELLARRSALDVFMSSPKRPTEHRILRPAPSKLEKFHNDSIVVNYQALASCSGVVKDLVVKRLEWIASKETDPRRPCALYELGVCNIAHFGDPYHLDEQRGVQYIIQAADAGNIVARGYLARLLESFGPAAPSVSPSTLHYYLEEAAAAGNEAAFDDLVAGSNDPMVTSRIIRQRLNVEHNPSRDDLDIFKANIAAQKPGVAEHMLHVAAQLGLIGHLVFLLEEWKVPVNFRGYWNDTALIAACRVGNVESALCLIEHGADVNLVNWRSENASHFLWRFTDQDAVVMLAALSEKNANFGQMAVFSDSHIVHHERGLLSSELDPLPILPGLPIERIAARGRATLLREMLNLGLVRGSVNGPIVRRMLLWAVKLNHIEICSILVEYSKIKNWRDESLSPPDIEQASWVFGGKTEGYELAAAVGWLSGQAHGWITPEVIWRRCCHGRRWKKALVETLTWLMSVQGFALYKFESAILHCLRTDDSTYTTVLRDTYKTVENQQPLGLTRLNTVGGWLLIHHVIAMGNRSMFCLLTKDELTAALLEWSQEEAPRISGVLKEPRYLRAAFKASDCYSLLAFYSKDLWFAERFRELGLEPYQPQKTASGLWKDSEVGGTGVEFASVGKKLFALDGTIAPLVKPPALLCSIDKGFYRMTRLLLEMGSDMGEKVTTTRTILHQSLSPESLRQDTIKFLFSLGGLFEKADGSIGQISPELLPQSLFSDYGGILAFRLLVSSYESPPGDLLDEKKDSVWRKIRRFRCPPIQTICQWILLFIAPGTTIWFSNPSDPFLLLHFGTRFPKYSFAKNFDPSLGPYSDKSTRYSEVMEASWGELLRAFPALTKGPFWYRTAKSIPTFCPSMVSLATSAGLKTPLIRILDFGCTFPWGSRRFKHPLDIARLPGLNRQVLANLTASHLQASSYQHKPSLFEIFFWNDLGLLNPEKDAYKCLYNLGYRHAFFYFVEFQVLGYAVLLALIYLALWLALTILAYPAAWTVGWHIAVFMLFWVYVFSMYGLPVVVMAGFLVVEAFYRLFIRCESKASLLATALLPSRVYTGYSWSQIVDACSSSEPRELQERPSSERNRGSWRNALASLFRRKRQRRPLSRINTTASDDLALTGPTFEPYTDNPDQQRQQQSTAGSDHDPTTDQTNTDAQSPTHDDDEAQQRRRSRKRAEFAGKLIRKSIAGVSTLVTNAFYYAYKIGDNISAAQLRERQLQRRDRYIRESGEFSGREGGIAI